jgi:hypothetical protein
LEPGLIRTLRLDHGVDIPRSRGIKRALAKKHDLEAWLTEHEPRWIWNWRHQELLYKKLREVSMGRSKRLMIMMPPRHGKSELVTVRYVAYRLTRDPSLNVIVGSYNQRLANRFSRKIRNVWLAAREAAAQSEPPALAGCSALDIKTASVSLGSRPPAYAGGSDCGSRPAAKLPEGGAQGGRVRSAQEWETPAGGGVRAVGVGAGITGFGASLVVIDDPVKNRAEAESEAYRQRVWDWFGVGLVQRRHLHAAGAGRGRDPDPDKMARGRPGRAAAE